MGQPSYCFCELEGEVGSDGIQLFFQELPLKVEINSQLVCLCTLLDMCVHVLHHSASSFFLLTEMGLQARTHVFGKSEKPA